MRNMYIRTISKNHEPGTPTTSTRKNHMEQIRKSLKKNLFLSQQITLHNKRLSLTKHNSDKDFLSKKAADQPLEQKGFGKSEEKLQVFEEKFQILEKLGEGSNGLVRRCIKKNTQEEFAVKSFSFEDEQLPGLKANFLLMRRLKHPNITKYQALYFDMKKRTGWLVMELVKAKQLNKAVMKSEKEIMRVMFQLFETLSYLHRQDIVHRDIKPENIMYFPETGMIKLIDFGISKRFKRGGTLIDMWTHTGTLYYRAPQMFSGGYGQGIDVWSAGVLLYKLVTGKTPFESEYQNQTIKNITEGTFKITFHFDTYSPRLKLFLLKLLTKNPEERQTSCMCLEDVWFSPLIQNLMTKKRDDKDISSNSIIRNRKCSFNLKISPTIQLDNISQVSRTGLTSSVRPYVRKVNGQEYHCIDSEWGQSS